MTLLLAALLVSAQDPARDALRRGLEHLQHAEGSDDLVAWTLVSADVPLSRPALRDRLERVLSRPPATTFEAALRAMMLSRIDPPKYRAALRQCAQFLADNQAVDGLWGEGAPIDAVEPYPADVPPGRAPRAFGVPARPIVKFPVKARRAGPAAGDVANARWAAEGLLACERAGAVFAEGLLARAADAWRAEGRDAWEAAPALATLWHLQGRDIWKDPDVAKAQERLRARETPTDPWRLYELRRTSVLLGRDLFPDAAAAGRALQERQRPDGSWGGVRETCGAVLFLWRPEPLILRPR
jgi:hypothetical protein